MRRSSLLLLASLLTCTLLGTTARAAPPSDIQPSDQPEGPLRPGHRGHRQGPALSFDESVGASATTPRVEGLEQASEDKHALDRAIPKLFEGPQVQVLAGARVIPEEIRGFEVQVTATQSWSLAGYGRERIAAARAETEVLEVEARAVALEQRLAAAHAWIRLHAAELQLQLAEQELTYLRELVATLELAREEGVVTRSVVADAKAREAEAVARVSDWVGEVHDLGLVLARETGVGGRQPLRTSGDYPDPQLPSEDELRQIFSELDQLPAVAQHRLQARANRAQAAEVQAMRATTMNAGVSFQRESGSDVVIFGVLGANVGIDKGQRERGVAVAAAHRAEAEAEATELALETTLTTALHDLHHTREQFDILGQLTLPAQDELVASRQEAVELGEGTLPLLLEARARRSAIASELAAAEAAWVWARVEVWIYLEAFLAEHEEVAP